jgi:hypothetical protein
MYAQFKLSVKKIIKKQFYNFFSFSIFSLGLPIAGQWWREQRYAVNEWGNSYLHQLP